jgi:hypothetical protein
LLNSGYIVPNDIEEEVGSTLDLMASPYCEKTSAIAESAVSTDGAD